MLKQDTLKPIDMAIVLALVTKGEAVPVTYDQVGQVVGVSQSTSHESVKRLQHAGLLLPESKQPNRTVLLSFLEFGVRCTFPPTFGRQVRGIPTAHAGPALRAFFDDLDPLVWPDPDGSVRGTGLAPLYGKATELPNRAPALYDALTLVDAVRAGQARERNAALDALKSLIGGS